MALGGNIGNGTKIAYSLSSPLSFVKVGQLLEIPTFIQLISNDVDTTVHSTSRVMTSMPGMVPVPEISIDVLADLDETTSPAQEALRQFQANGQTVYWRIEVPVDRAQTKFRGFEFQAYVKEWSPDVTKIADAQKLKITLRYGGGLNVYAAGASVIG